jgi:putative oxidoreductase
MIDGKTAPYAALLLRVSMGILFILHGAYLKIFVFSMAGTGKYFASLGLPDWWAWVAMLYETIGGLALILGIQAAGLRRSLAYTCSSPLTSGTPATDSG